MLKEEVGQNIEKLVINQEELSDLETQAEQLNEGAGKFEKNAKILERHMFWKKVKYAVIIGLIIILVIVIIVLIVKFA